MKQITKEHIKALRRFIDDTDIERKYQIIDIKCIHTSDGDCVIESTVLAVK